MFRCLISSRTRVDVAVLCDMLQDIVTSMLLSRHLRSRDSRSSVTLPRNWCLQALRRNPGTRSEDPMYFIRVVELGKLIISHMLQPRDADTGMTLKQPSL